MVDSKYSMPPKAATRYKFYTVVFACCFCTVVRCTTTLTYFLLVLACNVSVRVVFFLVASETHLLSRSAGDSSRTNDRQKCHKSESVPNVMTSLVSPERKHPASAPRERNSFSNRI